MTTGSAIPLGVTALYYILTIPLAILSAFTIYIFIRYGKTTAFTLGLSLAYILFFITVFSNGSRLLGTL